MNKFIEREIRKLDLEMCKNQLLFCPILNKIKELEWCAGCTKGNYVKYNKKKNEYKCNFKRK